METSAFIEAITETLLISTAQAFAIVLFFRVMFSAVPGIPSAIRYRLWYSSLILIFGLFVYTLLSMYGQKVQEDTVTAVISTLPAEQGQLSWLAKLESLKLKYAGIIAVLYLTGVSIQFLSLTVAWFKTRSLGYAEPLLQDPIWVSRLEALREKLQIARQVSLHVSEKITVPITAGFIKPIILLPVAMVSRLNPEQVEAILLHELAHIKRLDFMWNILQKVIESILFFNPFVWLIVKEIHKEREYCCDEIVVSETADPLTYAKALLQLEVQIKHNELAMSATGTEKYPLFDRIKRISGMKNPDPSPKTGLMVLATILCVGLSLAVALPHSEKDIKSSQETELKSLKKNQFITRTEKTQFISTDIDEGRPAITKVMVKGPQNTDTLCLEEEELKGHQLQLDKHAENIRNHALQNRKHQEALQQHAEAIRKHFESQEWKDMQTELAEHSKALARAAVVIAPEPEELPSTPPAMPKLHGNQGKLNLKIAQLQRKFESPEWQAKQMRIHRKIADFTKKITSADWDKHGSEIEIQVEELVKGFDDLALSSD